MGRGNREYNIILNMLVTFLTVLRYQTFPIPIPETFTWSPLRPFSLCVPETPSASEQEMACNSYLQKQNNEKNPLK